MVTAAFLLAALLPSALAATGYYTISPAKNAQLCLSASNHNGEALSLVDCNADNVVFKYSTGSGKLKNVENNVCADVKDGLQKNKTPIQAWACSQCNTHQAFQFTKVDGSDGNNVIRWAGSPYCLDLPDGKAEANATVQIWRCADNNDNQLWTVAEAINPAADSKAAWDAAATKAAVRRHHKAARHH